jgi:hypothetical protein
MSFGKVSHIKKFPTRLLQTKYQARCMQIQDLTVTCEAISIVKYFKPSIDLPL